MVECLVLSCHCNFSLLTWVLSNQLNGVNHNAAILQLDKMNFFYLLCYMLHGWHQLFSFLSPSFSGILWCYKRQICIASEQNQDLPALHIISEKISFVLILECLAQKTVHCWNYIWVNNSWDICLHRLFLSALLSVVLQVVTPLLLLFCSASWTILVVLSLAMIALRVTSS